MTALTLIALTLLLPSTASAQTPSRQILSAYILPNTAELVHAAGRLKDSLTTQCQQPDTFTPQKIKADFDRLATQWAYVEVLRFGPLVEANRFERFFMWPDTGRTGRQIQAAVTANQQDVLDAGQLAKKSVALQGMPALEYILFQPDLKTDPAFRCAYALAIATRLDATAMDIAAGWQVEEPFGKSFSTPSKTGIYHSQREVLAETVKALVTALKFTRETKLLPALGATPEQARFQRAYLWRSHNTFHGLSATLDAVTALYRAAGFEALLKDDPNKIGSAIAFELARAQEVANRLRGVEAAQAFSDPATREDISYIAVLLESVHSRIAQDLAPVIGVGVGFNALDGD
jgi:uncharacterized protein